MEIFTMATATLTSKGQITMIAASKTVKDLKGLIRKPAHAVSIEDMNRAIAAQGATAG